MGKMGIDDFIKYAKEQFGVEISLESDVQSDSFESIFGGTFSYTENDMISELDNIGKVKYENESVSVKLDFATSEFITCSGIVGFAA